MHAIGTYLGGVSQKTSTILYLPTPLCWFVNSDVFKNKGTEYQHMFFGNVFYWCRVGFLTDRNFDPNRPINEPQMQIVLVVLERLLCGIIDGQTARCIQKVTLAKAGS